ncbi:MAG: hypothetical protein AAB604_00385 [Patescibacteria group bacterium]|mgnify:CR=1 FL=1
MFLIAGIAILYTLGFIYRWNFELWWFDVLLHFLGGMWVAIAANRFFVRPIGPIGLIGPILVVALVAFVGVGWEVYEFTIDELFFEDRALWRAQDGNTDTMTDLMMDVLGGIIVAGYTAYTSYRSSRSYERST